jgi:hypothetical protein
MHYTRMHRYILWIQDFLLFLTCFCTGISITGLTCIDISHMYRISSYVDIMHFLSELLIAEYKLLNNLSVQKEVHTDR